MKTRTKLIFLTGLVVCLSAVTVAWRYPQFKAVTEKHAKMEKRNALLRKHLTLLEAELRTVDPDELQLATTTKASPETDDDYIPVKLRVIKEAGFSVLEGRSVGSYTLNDYNPPGPGFKLSDQAIGMLALSPDETGNLQKALSEFQSSLDAFLQTGIREAPFEELDREHMDEIVDAFSKMDGLGSLTFFDPEDTIKKYSPPYASGRITAYTIPALKDSDLTMLQNWFADTVTNIIGPDRADILLRQVDNVPDFWLHKGQHALLAFLDRGDPQAGTASTQWIAMIYDSPDGTNRIGGASSNPIPPVWSHLFQETIGEASAWRKIAP